MMRSGGFLLFLVLQMMLFVLIKSQNQTEGFINVDCGLTHESSYEEPQTNLIYKTDTSLIQSGKAGKIDKQFKSYFFKPTWRLRSFPYGKRNCYNVEVQNNRRYLIRATFIYGNHDGANLVPSFDLYIGANKWSKINGNHTIKEVIHVTKSQSIQICLVNIGSGTPYINVLELRPLDPKSYVTPSGSLKLLARMYLSNYSRRRHHIRYPNDVYDRDWSPYFAHELWKPITTNQNISTMNEYSPPEKVMSAAATPIDGNATLDVEWILEPPNAQCFFYTYFAELQTIQENDTREFDLVLNREIISDLILPEPLQATTVTNKLPKQCTNGKCVLQLEKTLRSTLPPLLNAFEVYTVMNFPQLETNDDDVNGIKDVQDTYKLRRITWQGDPCVPKQFLWQGLNCNHSDNSTLPTIVSLNLSSSGLTGVISEAIQNLTHLQQLDLSNNNLSGEIPDFLASMKSLMLINLSRNNLSGLVPQNLVKKKGLTLNVEGNPFLNSTTEQCANKEENGGRLKGILVPVSVVIASVAHLAIALLLFFYCRQNKSANVQGQEESVGLSSAEPNPTTRFTYAQIRIMTSNFQKVIGEGGFGRVYLGVINGAQQVVVKVLSHSSQGYRQFKAEVQQLLRVHHKNVVGFIGYCVESENPALIYEYMANGNLEDHMSGRTSSNFIMQWGNRLKIATESAQGLEYLHSGITPAIVHRDVKLTNVLLDDQFEAKIADFGLSKSFSRGESHLSTVVAGTPGYLDPDYYRTGWLTTKSDIYSFGIVMLQLFTNQPVVDLTRDPDQQHIREWVADKITTRDIGAIIDARISRYNTESAWLYLEVAMACLDGSSSERPTMTEVVNALKQCRDMDVDVDDSIDSEILTEGR